MTENEKLEQRIANLENMLLVLAHAVRDQSGPKYYQELGPIIEEFFHSNQSLGGLQNPNLKRNEQ